jgi:hypothetical protein
VGFKYAGLWGPQPFLSGTTGRPLPSVTFTVYERDGSTVATLYTSRAKTATADNPTVTDIYGNGAFFADPGNYYVECNGVMQLVHVPADVTEAYLGGRRQHDLSASSPIFAETMPRYAAVNDLSALTTQVVLLTAIELPPRMAVSNITFVSGATAAGTPTNWWFVLCDSARVVKAVSSDQTVTAWAANTAKTLSVSASGYTTPGRADVHYVGIMMKATTPVSLRGSNMGHSIMSSWTTPTLVGTSSTGQTTPVALGTTLAALTATALVPYVAVA